MHLSFDARKNDIEIKQKQKELEEETDPLKKELIQVELDEKTYSKASMQLVAAHRMREVTEWSNFKRFITMVLLMIRMSIRINYFHTRRL